jgi:hypothetical protein
MEGGALRTFSTCWYALPSCRMLRRNRADGHAQNSMTIITQSTRIPPPYSLRWCMSVEQSAGFIPGGHSMTTPAVVKESAKVTNSASCSSPAMIIQQLQGLVGVALTAGRTLSAQTTASASSAAQAT